MRVWVGLMWFVSGFGRDFRRFKVVSGGLREVCEWFE